jgi:hypothetical protein
VDRRAAKVFEKLAALNPGLGVEHANPMAVVELHPAEHLNPRGDPTGVAGQG